MEASSGLSQSCGVAEFDNQREHKLHHHSRDTSPSREPLCEHWTSPSEATLTRAALGPRPAYRPAGRPQDLRIPFGEASFRPDRLSAESNAHSASLRRLQVYHRAYGVLRRRCGIVQPCFVIGHPIVGGGSAGAGSGLRCPSGGRYAAQRERWGRRGLGRATEKSLEGRRQKGVGWDKKEGGREGMGDGKRDGHVPRADGDGSGSPGTR